MAEIAWTWYVSDGASAASPGGNARELGSARGRTLSHSVSGYATATFSLDGRSDDTAAVVERMSDLWIYRDGVLLFRGRVVQASDSVNANEHATTFTAIDYRGMLTLAAKVEPPVPTFSGVDQGKIPWDLIVAWQALTKGDWGISQGVGSVSGTTRDETDITAGAPVGEVIDRMANRDGGFEWAIEPDPTTGALKLNRWHPTRGNSNGVVLDYGGNLEALSVGTAMFGNAAVATGDQDTTAATWQAAGLATDDRGRWTISQGFPTVSKQSTVLAKAKWLAAQGSTVESEWSATMTPGAWGGRADLWIGDTVILAVSSGRLQVSGDHRVTNIEIHPGDDGTETVKLGLVGTP